MANIKPTFYIGVTNNLPRRVYEHRYKLIEGFTKKYNITKLLYYEIFSDIKVAIAREKQLKHWNRIWKFNLIKKSNSDFHDLYDMLM